MSPMQDSAYRRFIEAEAGPLLRVAYLLSAGNQSDAEDLVQECLIKVADKWTQVARSQDPSAYTRKMLTRLFIDGARKGASRPSLSGAAVPDAVVAPDHSDAVCASLELRQALRQLPPSQRASIVLRYLADLDFDKVGDLMGISASSARSNATRGLARLRSLTPSLNSSAR